MKKTILALCLLFSAFACSKNDSSDEDNLGITSDFYFSAKIDGEQVLFQHEVDGCYNGVSHYATSIDAGYHYGEGMLFMQLTVPVRSMGVMLVKEFSDVADCQDLDNLFQTGNYDLGVSAYETLTDLKDGVVIFYTDEDGVYWSSDLGGTAALNGSFELTSYTDYSTTQSSKVMKAKFSCTLYDGNGNSKTLTEGKISSVCLHCSLD